MTPWSTPALLLLGIAAGPYGLNLMSPSVVLLLDPGIAMAVAMLGVFVAVHAERRFIRITGAAHRCVCRGFRYGR
jgi:hypothetical protein